MPNKHKTAFKQMPEYSRLNPDQIRNRKSCFYIKFDAKRVFSINVVTLLINCIGVN